MSLTKVYTSPKDRIAPRNQVYEVWYCRKDNSTMLIGGDSNWHFESKLKKWLKKDYELLGSFQASSWTSAKEAHNLISNERNER